jgi:hypothetical protein
VGQNLRAGVFLLNLRDHRFAHGRNVLEDAAGEGYPARSMRLERQNLA